MNLHPTRTLAPLLVLLVGCVGPRNASGPIDAPLLDADGTTVSTISSTGTSTRRLAGRTVVVDAGHGGKDPGASGVAGIPEKSINLAVAAELAAALERRGARVVLSRSDDRFLTLDERAALADRTRCDLFVSVHTDSATPQAEGATVYLARGALGTSERAGEAIDGALRRAGIRSRGVKKAGFRVLVGHSRPSALIECGYLTHPDEGQRLADAGYQRRIAEAIATGVESALR